MSRQLYVGAMVASRRRGDAFDNQIQSFTVIASSAEEALGYAYAEMGRQFPSSLGYGCSGKLTPIAREDVAAWLAAYDEAAGG